MLEIPCFDVPTDLQDWQDARPGIRATIWELLGVIPAPDRYLTAATQSRTQHEGYWLEQLVFRSAEGEPIEGYLLLPDAPGPHPAILYCHWHGGQYEVGKDELFGMNATPVAPGPELARQGYVVLAIDAPGFGGRNGHGGRHPRGGAGELSAAKEQLWFGRTLWGITLTDDLMALDYLASRPEVDPSRIGVTGISMGSTRAWWIMALDDRPKAASCVACLTRYQDLIEAKALAAHGIYYFVPGMLKHFDTEVVTALSAPRAMLFQTGDQDDGSPIKGIEKINDAVSRVYAAVGATEQFQSIIYPCLGHVYTMEMWRRTLDWFEAHL